MAGPENAGPLISTKFSTVGHLTYGFVCSASVLYRVVVSVLCCMYD